MDAGHHAKETENGVFRNIMSAVGLIVFVVAFSWVLKTFVFQPYQIPSGSMEETIMTGDLVFSEKVSYYIREPEVGDVVTFADPEVAGRTLIKRVVAVGGQTVTLNNGHVYVDGVMASEAHTQGASYPLDRHALNAQISYPYTVPLGYVWVMGDNRENSADSRYFGAIPSSSISGRAMLVYWPLQDIGLLTK